jgi:hypothetical protein
MPTMAARGTRVLASALLIGSLVGCSDDLDLDDSAPWRTSRTPVATEGLVWATGSTVHLADGTTVDTGATVRAFVVGGDGVFFVPAEAEDDIFTFTDAPLWFAAPGREAEDTGLAVDATGVAVSPDGSTLAVLDADTDDGSAVMRLFDLSSGEATTSEDGMDTSGIDDPVHHLLESEVEILGITDDEVWARALEGDFAYDLATGEGRELGDDEPTPGATADPQRSPDGSWGFEERRGLHDVLVSSAGDVVVPDPGTARWALSRWVDDRTVLGVAVDGPGKGDVIGPGDSLTLVTCEVPSGACRSVAGTTGEQVVFPLGTVPGWAVDLRPRDES